MDRPIVYTQEQGRSVDFLFAQRATMIAVAKLAQAAFGISTFVRGLAVTPNSPAALNVLVGIGEIYTNAQVDATTWGSLPADTTDYILKQGLNMSAQTIATPAPSAAGYSINYLIEAQYQDSDTNPAVLPFYNSSNAQQPLNGPGGAGTTLPTQRQGLCTIQAKAGVAATTGTQTTPAVDSGWTAIGVVTVANGQSTVTSGNISIPAGVPQITSLLQMMQTGSPCYAVDTSTVANTITLALTPAITSYTDGQEITFKAANTNTGPCTINAGGGSVNLVGAAGALQGGELVAGCQYTSIYSASLGELVLNSQTGGAEQINPATKSQHAVQLGQLTSVGINPGRLLRTSVYYNNAGTLYVSVNGGAFAAAGSSNFATLAATQTVDAECQGAGAGSGGVAASGSSQYGASSSGQGGAYCRGLFTAAQINGALITCGAAGTAGAAGNNNGGNGGTSSVGALMTSPGGIASTGSGVTSNATNFISPQVSTTQAAPTGTYYLGIPCSGADLSIGLTSTIGLRVAPGGSTPLGTGGQTRSSSGNNGNGFGAGASGAGIGVSTAAQAGFAGAPGAVIFREYA